MAQAKKKPLPEINIDSGVLVDEARKAIHARSEKAQAETEEKDAKKKMAEEAEKIRAKCLEDSEGYIGLIRVTSKTQEIPPTRVEFRMSNGALDINEKGKLDEMFGASRPLLFGREKVITEILDPDKLIEQMKAAGKNPWDFLTLSVKSNMDRVVDDAADKTVVSQEAYLPKSGFLATLDDIAHTLADKAKEYVKAYLAKTLKPSVVIGSKGKA
jgi:hypothetical protein